MNTTQRNYLRGRIKEITSDAIADLRNRWGNKHTKKSKSLTKLERIALIRKGKVKLKPLSKLESLSSYCLNNVDDVYDFSEFEWNKELLREDELDAQIIKIQEAAQRTEDIVMLGDSDAAVKILEQLPKDLKALAVVPR